MQETVPDNLIAVLPLGAHEQHGPHLPFETDTIIADGIAARLANNLPEHITARFLTTEPVGYSVEHMDVEGSRTLAFSEAVNRWVGIGENLCAANIRKLVILNAHGGNSPLATIVATELRARLGMLAVATHWTRFGIPEELISLEQKHLDIHAGYIETSVMLALAPELVHMDKAQNFTNVQGQLIEDYQYLRAYGPHAFGWMMSDLNKQGAAGNALRANAQDGEKIIAHAVKGLTGLMEDVHRFDISAFGEAPTL
ncbi:creatininase family protein [Pseudochrobactrum kiredjianiae]|uniref:Creatininase family protein n=1 Tax=Pseudochrobactrum kiredjianiae TaxID=386305 RepID=A0ABW3UZ70_9HYPH|nr:creatininase family protein [Pseudochrobactrum kiredjianiae]MDM7852172.1 creatininase family protein [Pseudochrobactrum kiredjianiae]